MSYHIPLISIILSGKLLGTHLTKMLSFTKFCTYLEFLVLNMHVLIVIKIYL